MGSILRRLLFFFRRNQFDRDLEDELRFHEEMKAGALADADGMSGRPGERGRPRGGGLAIRCGCANSRANRGPSQRSKPSHRTRATRCD